MYAAAMGKTVTAVFQCYLLSLSMDFLYCLCGGCCLLRSCMDFYEIDTKPGPHGGISLIDRRPNSHTAYLKPIEIEWLRRKYNEAETEEDRMAAHSILRRFSL